MNEDQVMSSVETLADEVWDFLDAKAAVDGRGGAEYTRRINALRVWLWDTAGRCPTEDD